MFEKDKPKKELTDKQRKALAAGRKKLKSKRDNDDIEISAIKTRQKEERHERKRVADEKREIEIYNRLMEKGNEKIEKFKQHKYKWLDQAKNVKEYSEFKSVLDTITEEDILHDTHIGKLKHSLSSYTSPAQSAGGKSAPKGKSEPKEEPEEEPEEKEEPDEPTTTEDIDDVVNVY